MKKILLGLGLLLGSMCQVEAATSVTSPSVSGHWTMAGSPYLVYNDIKVLANTSLTIDPGVEVIFQGLYEVNVQGILRAVGSAGMPISFKISDTTGWHDDESASGGWRGILFSAFASTSGADSSAFEYCNVTDIKYGSTTYTGYYTGCFYVERDRHLLVKNCDFSHNIAKSGYGRVIVLRGPQTIDSCTIHNNVAIHSIISMSLATPVINHSALYDNLSYQIIAAELVYPGEYHSAEILNSDIHDNITTMQGSQVNVTTGHALIRGCKIHHNINPDEGAIYCTGGMVEITGNLICNNSQTVAGTCGAVEGGGAMHLCFNSSTSSADSTAYIVRNNIIANNYSASSYGTGVYVWHANVWIMNNTIINNVGGGAYGVAIGLINAGSSSHIKNNIIYNNKPSLSSLPFPEVWVLNGDTVEFEHNWMPRGFSQMVTTGAYTLAGDTTTNFISANPLLVHPTDTASVTESALMADFSLTSASPCINKGDNSGCMPYTTDYANNPRINSSTIDIGAYEYQSSESGAYVKPVVSQTEQMQVYPNPASGRVNIAVPQAAGRIRIMDATGRLISSRNVAAGDIITEDITRYSKGLYIVEWASENGASQVRKIMVE